MGLSRQQISACKPRSPCNSWSSSRAPRSLPPVLLCWGTQWRSRRAIVAYLLGLLAMIKCSICSYQYDN